MVLRSAGLRELLRSLAGPSSRSYVSRLSSLIAYFAFENNLSHMHWAAYEIIWQSSVSDFVDECRIVDCRRGRVERCGEAVIAQMEGALVRIGGSVGWLFSPQSLRSRCIGTCVFVFVPRHA